MSTPTVEAAIVQRLRADSNITQYVNSFNGSAAIFSDIAPQEAEGTYVVFDVQDSASGDNLGVDGFIIDVDTYGGRNSTADMRALGLAIKFSLDRAVLNCDEYKTLRVYFESRGNVENKDIQITHHNMQFSARGSRYAWMQQIVR